MKRTLAFFLVAAMASTLAAAAVKPIEVRGFSFSNLYFYWQNGWFSNIPYENIYTIFDVGDYYLRGSDVAAEWGVGYTVLNFWDLFFGDFEYDYSRLHFPSARIDNHNLGFNMTYWLTRRRVLAACIGMGLTFQTRKNDFGHGWTSGQHYVPFWFSLGCKWKLGRHLVLRADGRFFSRSTGYYDDWYYYDHYYYEDYQYEDFGMRLAVGVELHLGGRKK